MSEQDRSSHDTSGLTERLKRDLGSGVRTAKVVWKTSLAPGLKDIGKRMRQDGIWATEQAGVAFADLGKRLRHLGGKLTNR